MTPARLALGVLLLSLAALAAGELKLNLNVKGNAASCRTAPYHRDLDNAASKILVVRRQCVFTIGGSQPLTGLVFDVVSSGGAAQSIECKPGAPSSNGFKCDKAGNDPLNIQVTTDNLTPIGHFSVRALGAPKPSIPCTLFVVFNPYAGKEVQCKPNAGDKYLDCVVEDAVENEKGFIWVGDPTNFRGWNYDQFNTNNLLAAFRLLDSLPLKDRTSPVKVSRKFSARGNDALEGNWSGKYTGGKEPWFWTGTTAILDAFMKTGSATKYGQCWVFAGLLTTLLRSVGIPSRVVTNFQSAHESAAGGKYRQIITEYYESKGGKTYKKNTAGSIWNFHVWVEAMMSRAEDIGEQYSGWQAVDATPQEESDGEYQCGPASLKAMVNGDFKKKATKYDAGFVAGETNADVVRMLDGKYHSTATRQVGTSSMSFAYTATLLPAGSPDADPQVKGEDRSVLYKIENQPEIVVAPSSVRFRALQSVGYDISAEILRNSESYVRVGRDVPIKIKIRASKPSTVPLTIDYTVSADIAIYNGKKLSDDLEPFQVSGSVLVHPGKASVVSFVVESAWYKPYLKATHSFIVTFAGALKGSSASTVLEPRSPSVQLVDSKIFELKVPQLTMLARNNLVQSQLASVNIMFTNPFHPEPLTNVQVSVSITGADHNSQEFTLEPNIDWSKKPVFLGNVQTRTKLVGEVLMVASMTCDQLADVYGFHVFNVAPAR